MGNVFNCVNGISISNLGQGTWFIGEKPEKEEAEMKTLEKGLELGLTLIDTAEIYGKGNSEKLVGKVVKNHHREGLYLCSKVHPLNSGKKKIFKSCEDSLRRLQTDYLDMYLLHWREKNMPELPEIVECMEELVRKEKIRNWGVSNFNLHDMEELWAVNCGNHCTVNQILYHMGSRGIEYNLYPWLEQHRIKIMAYCPLAQAGTIRAGMLDNKVLSAIADKYTISIIQLLLAFVLRRENIIAIPKASTVSHVQENVQVKTLKIKDEDWELINKEFPAPIKMEPLDIV